MGITSDVEAMNITETTTKNSEYYINLDDRVNLDDKVKFSVLRRKSSRKGESIYGTNTVVDGVAVHAGACVCSVLICSASTLRMTGKHSTTQLLHYLTLRSFGTVRWFSG